MKIQSVVKAGKDKFEDVVSTDSTKQKLQDRLLQDDQESITNNFDNGGAEFTWQPLWSRVQLKITDDELLNTKTKSGLIIVESKDKKPYIEAEIIAIGTRVGYDANSDRLYEQFQVGDIVRVFEKHVEFHYLDGKGHSEYFVPGRPYHAYCQDKYFISKRVRK